MAHGAESRNLLSADGIVSRRDGNNIKASVPPPAEAKRNAVMIIMRQFEPCSTPRASRLGDLYIINIFSAAASNHHSPAINLNQQHRMLLNNARAPRRKRLRIASCAPALLLKSVTRRREMPRHGNLPVEARDMASSSDTSPLPHRRHVEKYRRFCPGELIAAVALLSTASAASSENHRSGEEKPPQNGLQSSRRPATSQSSRRSNQPSARIARQYLRHETAEALSRN